MDLQRYRLCEKEQSLPAKYGITQAEDLLEYAQKRILDCTSPLALAFAFAINKNHDKPFDKAGTLWENN